MSQLPIVIGHTYRRLTTRDAPWDFSGNYRKIHDWTLYVDVVDDSYIRDVQFDLGDSFQQSMFTCCSPVPHNGKLRFSTRQQTYGFITATVRVRSSGLLGCWSHSISENESSKVYTVDISNSPLVELRPLRLSQRQYGVELELTSDMSPDQVAQQIHSVPVEVMEYTHQTTTHWKLVPDSSIVCNPSLPDCRKFELVSPILKSGEGLSDFHKILSDLGKVRGMIQVNESMGFHVHVDVSDLAIFQLIKVCQNFVKYEHVMDTFMPKARRSDSSASRRYFRSHQTIASSNRARHDRLARCQTVEELAHAMSSDRYAKLNLHNLVSGRQPTIEFRQHYATTDYAVLSSWIRFCVRFVENSARYRTPTSLSSDRSLADARKFLFDYVIKDRSLAKGFAQRQIKVVRQCCQRCEAGHGCALHRSVY